MCKPKHFLIEILFFETMAFSNRNRINYVVTKTMLIVNFMIYLNKTKIIQSKIVKMHHQIVFLNIQIKTVQRINIRA